MCIRDRFCILAALKFDYILDLASLGYTACGGAVVPYLPVSYTHLGRCF